METILTTSIRTIIGFVLLLILTRLLGKKQLSQITIFTYITGIALGNIAGDMVVHRDIKLIDGVVGLTLWAVLALIVEYISLKSPKARILLDGEPTIVIKKGEIIRKVMANNKLNMDDLTMLLRAKNVFSIAEVEYAILEPNGQISVLKKADHELVTKKDMNIKPSVRKYLPSELIVDGKVVKRNLKELGLEKTWLQEEIGKRGYRDIKEIFYAEIQADGSLFINRE